LNNQDKQSLQHIHFPNGSFAMPLEACIASIGITAFDLCRSLCWGGAGTFVFLALVDVRVGVSPVNRFEALDVVALSSFPTTACDVPVVVHRPNAK
jgi:hypothetical protein